MTSSDYRKLSFLLSNIKNGERSSFSSVYGMYEKKVYFLFCKLLGSKTAASEMTIELFDHVYLKLNAIDDPMDFEKWLFTLVFSRARQYVLNKHPEEFGDYFDTDSPAGDEADILLTQDADEMMSYPEGINVSVDMMKTVDSVLSELPLKLRIAVLQYYFCGFEMAEISAAEQISLMAVKNRLLKARIRMKTEEHKYTELGYDCVGLVVFLPDILSVMTESIVVASDIASGVTSRTGIKCVSGGVQSFQPGVNNLNTESVLQTKSSNFAPTEYGVIEPPKPKNNSRQEMSPAVKVIMAIVAIIVIIGGTVAVMLAIQNKKSPDDMSTTTTELTTINSVIEEMTTSAPTTQSTTETTTEAVSEIVTETTTVETTETTTELTTQGTTETTTAGTTAVQTTAQSTTETPAADNQENESGVGVG